MTTIALNVDGPGLNNDQRGTLTKEGASYITLSPYTPTNAKKRSKPVQKSVNFEDLFGPQKWTKYFEIENPTKDDFKLYNNLAEEVGTDVLFRHQKDGLCIIEAANEEQSEKLLELVRTDNPNLPVKKNESLNVSHGTIIVPNNIETGGIDFSECGKKIKDNMRVQGHEVKEVIAYIKPVRGNRKYPIRIAKITFEGRALPDTVIVAGQQLTVREYVPTPRQCNKCWKFGHGIKYCKSDFYICPICSKKGHQKDECTYKNKACTNCEGNHAAFSRSCMHYKKEQLIVKTRFKEGLSYRAAVSKLKQMGEISNFNYKRALESKPPVTSTPKMNKPTATNRFSVLQVEDSQSYEDSIPTSQKSPKRIPKRIRDSSSEEGGMSPKLNPKQKPKTKNQNKEIELHEVAVEVHAINDISLDDTIIYTDKDDKLIVEAGETSSPTTTRSELASSIVLGILLGDF